MKISGRSIAMATALAPRVAILNAETNELGFDGLPLAGIGRGCAFSPDGSLLAVAHSVSPYLTVYSTLTWNKVSGALAGITAIGYSCAFSPDGSLLAVGRNAGFAVFTVPGFSPVSIPDFTGKECNACAFSPNGNLLAIVYDAIPKISVLNVSDFSEVAGVPALPTQGFGCAFSPDNSLLAIAYDSSPYIRVYNTVDWTTVSIPSNLVGKGRACAFSPDGTMLAVAHDSTPFVKLYKVSDWSTIGLPAPTIISSITAGKSVAWLSNTHLFLGLDGYPGFVEYDVVSQTIVRANNLISDVNGMASNASSSGSWKISGTVDESLAADTWLAVASSVETGETLGKIEFTGASFTIPLFSDTPVSVTVRAEQGSIWEASSAVAINDKVYPTDPVTTPYYYQATVGGATGVSEPVWPVTAGGTVADGTATWIRVERLIQPVTQSPLIPVPV